MKRLLLFGLVMAVAVGCSAPKTATSKAEPVSSTTPPGTDSPTSIMDADEALRIGKQFAEEKGWEIRSSPTRATFDADRREWQIFFHMKHREGPFIVYVNDVTGVASYIVGE